MDYDEEQRNELEALEAIFQDEFKVLSAAPPRSLELLLLPNADGEDNHVALRMVADLPPHYPEESAQIRIRNEKGLNPKQIEELKEIVAEQVSMAASNAEVAIYTVAEALREYLSDHNKPQLSMHEQMEMRSNAKQTEEDEAIAKRRALEERVEAKKNEPSPLGIEPGTLLTPETFAHWRALFDAEQRAIREAKEAAKPQTSKLTGKQLFQQNLAKELDESEADALVEEEPANPPAKPFFQDASLFEEEDGEGDSEDSDDDEGEQDEELQSMFDTETQVEKHLKQAAAATSSSSSAAAASSSSSSSSSSAPKPAKGKK